MLAAMIGTSIGIICAYTIISLVNPPVLEMLGIVVSIIWLFTAIGILTGEK